MTEGVVVHPVSSNEFASRDQIYLVDIPEIQNHVKWIFQMLCSTTL